MNKINYLIKVFDSCFKSEHRQVVIDWSKRCLSKNDYEDFKEFIEINRQTYKYMLKL